MGSVRCSTVYPENLSGVGSHWGPMNCDDDMCQIDDQDDLMVSSSAKFRSALVSNDVTKVINHFFSSYIF